MKTTTGIKGFITIAENLSNLPNAGASALYWINDRLALYAAIMLLFATVVACGEPTHKDPGVFVVEPPPQGKILPTDECEHEGQKLTCGEVGQIGAKFYGNNCVKCHDDLAISEVRGANREEFDHAIETRERMKKFSVLTDDERNAIIVALNLDEISAEEPGQP